MKRSMSYISFVLQNSYLNSTLLKYHCLKRNLYHLALEQMSGEGSNCFRTDAHVMTAIVERRQGNKMNEANNKTASLYCGKEMP